jgi:hypothetical protein
MNDSWSDKDLMAGDSEALTPSSEFTIETCEKGSPMTDISSWSGPPQVVINLIK